MQLHMHVALYSQSMHGALVVSGQGLRAYCVYIYAYVYTGPVSRVATAPTYMYLTPITGSDPIFMMIMLWKVEN